MALGCLHDTVYLFVTGSHANDIDIGHLGVIGCFLFLISANYGQLDGIFDDRSEDNRKYRLLALFAPVTMVLLFIPSAVTDVPEIVGSLFNTGTLALSSMAGFAAGIILMAYINKKKAKAAK